MIDDLYHVTGEIKETATDTRDIEYINGELTRDELLPECTYEEHVKDGA